MKKLTRYERQIFFDRNIVLEAVIDPEKYFMSIEKKISFIEKTKFEGKSNTFIVKKLSLIFWGNKIRFVYNDFFEKGSQEYLAYGINSASTDISNNNKGLITIFLNPNIDIIDKLKNDFVKWLKFLIKHELIHRQQFLNILDRKILMSLAHTDELSDKKYLSGKQELMARAWEIVELFRFDGLNDGEITDLLKKGTGLKYTNNRLLKKYHSYYTMENAILRRLYKYMFEYLKEV